MIIFLVPRDLNSMLPRSPSFSLFPPEEKNNKTEIMFFLSAGWTHDALGRWLRYTVAQNNTRVCAAENAAVLGFFVFRITGVLLRAVVCYHGHSFPLVFISWVVIFHLHCSSPRLSPCRVSVLSLWSALLCLVSVFLCLPPVSGLHVSVSCYVSCFNLKVLRLVCVVFFFASLGWWADSVQFPRCLHSVLTTCVCPVFPYRVVDFLVSASESCIWVLTLLHDRKTCRLFF